MNDGAHLPALLMEMKMPVITGPFVPPLSGHTKRCTQYGWGFVHILSSSPLGCRIREEYLEQAFSYCAQEARQTQKGKSR
ncbi:uncharacterized [Tachysurus ichikawai]